MYSYHIFYFLFKWKTPKGRSLLFEDQTDIENIVENNYSNWERVYSSEKLDEDEKQDLYNEKNFFYEFVHPVLYDTGKPGSLLKHYERKEPQQKDREVSYIISCNGKTYTLKIDAINLNLYTTGVGMMTFFLINEREDQKEPMDILTINQCGRRIYPPFYKDIKEKWETANYLKIEGLNGDSSLCYEDFSGYSYKEKGNDNEQIKETYWTPASFIRNLISDLSEELIITPVIDDRMFVNCWYENDDLSKLIGTDEDSLEKFFLDEYGIDSEGRKIKKSDDFWYKYIYVDASRPSCQNNDMRLKLLNEQTYKRWQQDGFLYGASRYSFVFLTKNDKRRFQRDVLAKYMRTVYARMVELVLIQRASILQFSEKISQMELSKGTKVSATINEQITSLHKEYIRFVNQIHFREVTIQDQGIELYQLISKTLNIEEYVEDLEKEIEELQQYVSMVDDRIRNKNGDILNWIAALFLPAGVAAELLGNTLNKDISLPVWKILSIILIVMVGMYGILQLIKKSR